MTAIASSTFTVTASGASSGTGSLGQVNLITGGFETGSPLFDVTAVIAGTVSGTLTPGTIYVPHSLTIDTSAITSPLTVSSSFFNLTSALPGELIKAGIGTLVLTGSNNYSGGTEVQAGTLQLTGASMTGTVTVDGHATLDIAPTPATSSSIVGEILVNSNGIVLVDISTPGTSLLFEPASQSFPAGDISFAPGATGASATLKFGSTNTTLEGSSGALGAAANSSDPHSTISNFHLGDSLLLTDFTDVNHTSVTPDFTLGTLTVTDSSHTAVFGIASSLGDDDHEKLVFLRNQNGELKLAPAIEVTTTADNTATGSLRHAISTIATNGADNSIVLFDHDDQTYNVGGPTLHAIPVPSASTQKLHLFVAAGDSVTINGVFDSASESDGGLMTGPNGFQKSGSGTLTLTGDQVDLTGTVTVGSGTLDIETDQIGTSAYHFNTGLNATIAGTGNTLNNASFDNVQLGDSIKLNDFGGGDVSLSGYNGFLVVNETLPGGNNCASATLNISGASTLDFVLLRDSLDGSALVRAAILASDAQTFRDAVTTIKSPLYANTSFDVIDLSGIYGSIDLTNKAGEVTGGDEDFGTNPILLDTNRADVTIDGSFSGKIWKVGEGILTLVGDETDLGTITVGGGMLAIGAGGEQFTSHVTAVDLSPGHGTVAGSRADLSGLQVSNFHLGNAVLVSPVSSNDTVSVDVSSGVVTVTETGNLTSTFTIAGGVAVDHFAIGNAQILIPIIDSLVKAAAGDLGDYTEIGTGGTLDFTRGGFYDGQIFGGATGSGTIAVDLPTDQIVALRSFNTDIGSSGDFTGTLRINSGTLDLTGASYDGTLSVALGSGTAAGTAGSAGELAVTSCADEFGNGLDFTAIAPGSALDITDLSVSDISGYSFGTDNGATVLDLLYSDNSVAFEMTVPGGFDATSALLDGGIQILPDAHTLGPGSCGTFVAFGNETITAAASAIANGSFGDPIRPSTLTVTGSPSAIIDLRNTSLQNVYTLDASQVANATIVVNCTEFNVHPMTIRGSAAAGTAATLKLDDPGMMFFADNVEISGIKLVDLANAGETLVVNGGSHPAGLLSIHGSSADDVIQGEGLESRTINNAPVQVNVIDLSGIAFTGDGLITGLVGRPYAREYDISDGGMITHLDTIGAAGQDTINLVDTAQMSATFTADELGYAFAKGFTVERNGTPLSPSAPFTPPGGSPAEIFTGTLTTDSGTGALAGSIAVDNGTTHFVLSGSLNLGLVTISGGSDANPVVLFGSPGATVTLPSVQPQGQTSVEYVVNAGNNSITSGTASAMIWGGSGHDTISLQGAGTLVGGSGTASLNGGTVGGSAFGGSGTVILFGASGGGTLSGGGDHSVLISGGGITSINGSGADSISQAFFGSTDTTPGATDTFVLSDPAHSHDSVTVRTAKANVTLAAGDDTVLGGTGVTSVTGGEMGVSLLYIGNTSSGGKEQSIVTPATSLASLEAFGGDGADLFQASTGGSTLVGGTGSDTFIGSIGNGYMASRGVHDTFEFHDVSTTPVSGAGTFIVNGFTPGTDLLHLYTSQSTNAAALLASHSGIKDLKLVTIVAADIANPDANFTTPMVTQSALQLTLNSGQKIDLVGVTTLNVGDLLISNPA